MPFSRTEDGKIYQRPFGGMTTHYGEGIAQRTCAAADRTGHAILHTLYQQSLRRNAEFFIEYFAIDLIMDERWRVPRADRWNLDDGTIHRFRAHDGHAGDRRLRSGLFLLHFGAHTCTGDGNAMALRAGLPLQDMEFVQFHPTGIYGAGCLITEGAAARAATSTNSEGERFMERYAPSAKDLAIPRRGQPRHDHGDPRGPRRRRKTRITFICISSTWIPICCKSVLPGISESARIFAGVDVTKEPIPVLPTCHYNMGGIRRPTPPAR